MAIRELAERPMLVCKGTIGLGVKNPDKKHPDISEHFILDDAPAVRRVYGDDPRELDIMFPVDDLDKVIPTWFKFWSGQKRDDAGNIKDGTLLCIGEGPGHDEQGNLVPGVATWRARDRMPPKDEMMGERDPHTGYIQRKCFGTKCVDAGNCKQNMQVYCILPRVSPTDIYRVDTSSWRSIRNFFNTLNQMQMLGGRIAFRPFKIVKKEVPVPFWDKEKQKEYKSMKPLMFLEEWDHVEFKQLHGAQVEQVQQLHLSGKIRLRLPTAEEAMVTPSHELYPTESSAAVAPAVDAVPVQPSAQQRVEVAKQLLEHPDVKAMLAEYENATNARMSDKEKLLRARQFENEKDPVAAILAAIRGGIENARSKAAKPAAAPPAPAAAVKPAAVAPVTAAPPKGPQPDADGII